MFLSTGSLKEFQIPFADIGNILRNQHITRLYSRLPAILQGAQIAILLMISHGFRCILERFNFVFLFSVRDIPPLSQQDSDSGTPFSTIKVKML